MNGQRTFQGLDRGLEPVGRVRWLDIWKASSEA